MHILTNFTLALTIILRTIVCTEFIETRFYTLHILWSIGSLNISPFELGFLPQRLVLTIVLQMPLILTSKVRLQLSFSLRLFLFPAGL